MMKYIICLFLIFTGVFLSAATVPFRSGEIMAAEYSPNRPYIKNWSKHLFPPDSAKYYAAITVKLAPHRQISIYDYTIEVGGVKFPCVAIRTNDSTFEFTKKTFSPGKNDMYTLLFFIRDISLGSDNEAFLVSNASNAFNSPTPFKIKYCSRFNKVSAINKDGNF